LLKPDLPERQSEGQALHKGLNRQQIVSEAIAIADTEGLDAVSIRHIAASLKARPMSLYTHIGSKNELLDEMANEVIGEIIVSDPLPKNWRKALSLIARSSHEAFVSHPWVLEVLGRKAHQGPNALHHAEQLLSAIAPLNLTSANAWAALYVVDDYTVGHAWRVLHARGPRHNFPLADPATFPRLATALRDSADRGNETFETGLEAVLDGLETRFTHKTPKSR
jgi:AcrR family transcriptional regulator